MTDKRFALASVLFLGGMLAFVYGIANPGVGEGDGLVTAAVVIALGLLHLGTGLLARSWTALLLPPIAVLLAVPAGLPEATASEPVPIWFGLLIVVEPIGLVVLAAGILLARATRHSGLLSKR